MHAPAIYAASHVNHEVRVAWVSISVHACDPVPIDTMLRFTCYVRLATLLQPVAMCWVLNIDLLRMPGRNNVVRTWPNDDNIMQHPQMLEGKFDHLQT